MKNLEIQNKTKNSYFDNIKNNYFENNQNNTLACCLQNYKQHATIKKLVADKKLVIKQVGNMVIVKCVNQVYNTNHVYNSNGQIIAQVASNIAKSIFGKQNCMAYWEKCPTSKKYTDVIYIGYDIIPLKKWGSAIFGGHLSKQLSERQKIQKYNKG